MTFPGDCLQQKINDKITDLSSCLPFEDEIYADAQLSGALSIGEHVNKVPNLQSLPDAACNKGRFFYIEDLRSFRYSDGYYWTKDACSVLGNVNTNAGLWTWGFNSSGRLGDGTTVDRCSPGTVAGGGDWCKIILGRAQSGGIKCDGTLWTWGCNSAGAIGDGTTVSRCSPGTIAGGGTTWCQVSASNNSFVTGTGLYSMAAIKTDGTLWTWGNNTTGSLGDGTAAARCSPGTIAGGGTTWCSVSVGYLLMSAIKTDGTLWTWGCNSVGQLGDGTTVSRCSPGTTWGNFTNWCKLISDPSDGLAAIKTDGTLWTWGCNTNGQLGDGTTVNRCSPGTIAGGGTTWCQVAINGRTASAIKTDGTLWTWGLNTGSSQGIFGDGTTVDRCSPGTIGGTGTWCDSFRSIAGGSNVAIIALKTDGTLWTWGRNSCGNLGNGTTVARCSPGTIAGGGNVWKTIGGSSAIRTRGF